MCLIVVKIMHDLIHVSVKTGVTMLKIPICITWHEFKNKLF